MVKRWLDLPLMTMKGDAQKTWSVFSEFGTAKVLNFPLSRSRQWEDMEGHSEMTYPRSVLTWGGLASPGERGLLHCTMDMWVERDVICLRERDHQGIPTRKGSERISQRIRVRASVTKRSLRLDYSQDCFCPLTSPTLTLTLSEAECASFKTWSNTSYQKVGSVFLPLNLGSVTA